MATIIVSQSTKGLTKTDGNLQNCALSVRVRVPSQTATSLMYPAL